MTQIQQKDKYKNASPAKGLSTEISAKYYFKKHLRTIEHKNCQKKKKFK